MNPVFIKPDKRYCRGHIVMKDGVLRGHPEDVEMNTYTLPPLTEETSRIMYIDAIKFALAPPIVITREMAEALKGSTV